VRIHRKPNKTLRWLPFLFVTLALGAHSQERTSSRGGSLEDVLETELGTGTRKPVSLTPAAATVITADEIRRLGARNLAEVLESIPGMNLHLVQPQVNAPVFDLRGSFSDRGGNILFMRDGKPLRLLDSNSTMPEVFRLPVNMIERIEIIRGPASALYGTDALAGVVNIVTQQQPSEAGARVGSAEQRGAWAGLYGEGAIEWAIAATHSQNADKVPTRNIRSRVTPLYDQVFRHDYSDLDLKARYGAFSASVWALNYEKIETGDINSPRPRVRVVTQHRHFEIGYSKEVTATTELRASLYRTRFNGNIEGEVRQGTPQDGYATEQRTTFDVSLVESRWQGHRLRLHAGASSEGHLKGALIFSPAPGAPVMTFPIPDIPNRRVRFLSIQDEWAFAPNWELTVGIRQDQISDAKSVSNPRMGIVWRVNRTLTGKLLIGESFRAPAYGNASLADAEPERLRNSELLLDYRPSDALYLTANVFHYKARNLEVGPALPRTGQREARGAELYLNAVPAGQIRVQLGASIQHVENPATGERVPFSPRFMAKGALDWLLGASSVNVRWEHYRGRLRATGDLRPELPDYSLFHITAQHDFDSRLRFQIAVHNLLDKRVYVPVLGPGNRLDHELPRRGFAAQVVYRF
jgi:outer membrane receptor for ferrienterochelin and colicins